MRIEHSRILQMLCTVRWWRCNALIAYRLDLCFVVIP